MPEDITEKQVKEWLRMAMCNEFNIFQNSNKVIALLCYELLKEWDKSDG